MQVQTYPECENLFTPAHHQHIEKLCKMRMSINEYGMALDDTYVMFYCEKELMAQHAFFLMKDMKSKHVLEIGFGLGVFANAILEQAIDSYTVIEPHPEIVAYAKEWTSTLESKTQINIIEGPWQSTLDKLGTYNAIMYDTWPPETYKESDFENFVRLICGNHLSKNGRFSFFNSGTLLSAHRASVLAKYFKRHDLYDYRFTEVAPPCWTKPTTDFVIPIAEK